MTYYDVFNGDADGICALRQLRLAFPVESTIVTGLKRQIALLESVPAVRGDVVTVLDISLDRNRKGLASLLARGVTVQYFDHHHAAGPLPKHALLTTTIDESGASCTSTLVDRSRSALTVQAAMFCRASSASSHVARTSRGVL